MTLKTYTDYLFLRDRNRVLLVFTIVLFLASEGINMAYIRFLAKHNDNSKSNTLLADQNMFWLLLGLLQLGYFVLSWLRYFLLNVVVLLSN